jgi:hypothetical protein
MIGSTYFCFPHFKIRQRKPLSCFSFPVKKYIKKVKPLCKVVNVYFISVDRERHKCIIALTVIISKWSIIFLLLWWERQCFIFMTLLVIKLCCLLVILCLTCLSGSKYSFYIIVLIFYDGVEKYFQFIIWKVDKMECIMVYSSIHNYLNMYRYTCLGG